MRISEFGTREGRRRLVRRPWFLGIAAAGIVGALVAGFQGSKGDEETVSIQAAAERPRLWTCSMHPQIKLPHPGKCPICGMDLIPVETGGGAEESADVSLTMSETGRRLAEVETTEVRYRAVSHEIRLPGKVSFDESRLSYISAWMPGRLDRLYVDFTGIRVRKGDHLVEIYSPELIAAQEEYLQALRYLRQRKEGSLAVMGEAARTALESSREKLRLLGITEDQIARLEKEGRPQERVTIFSPVSGTVVHKNGYEGMYVKTGDRIYTIADLNRVWLYLDAYEQDIPWLHYGQAVTVEAEAYPGEVFRGRIAFIDPTLNEKTRTLRLRVNVDNPRRRLKPGMFVRATIRSVLGKGGEVYEPALAGKWICPMHPDVIKDGPGVCPICGMDLAPARRFGFAEAPAGENKVLVIPRSAPLITGRRAVVYVENSADVTGLHRYEGREVVLGPRAGDSYIVLSGVKAGERVVTKGAFKIDSAMQITAKPSMMNPAGYYSERDNLFSRKGPSAENAGLLREVLPDYFEAAAALADDDASRARGALDALRRSLRKVVAAYGPTAGDLGVALNSAQETLASLPEDLAGQREVFSRVSAVFKDVLERFEYREDPVHLMFCPMAFDGRGAFWLQRGKSAVNPYMGKVMRECGEMRGLFGRRSTPSRGPKGSMHH